MPLSKVYTLLMDNETQKVMAKEAGCSKSAVSKHKSGILRKLGKTSKR